MKNKIKNSSMKLAHKRNYGKVTICSECGEECEIIEMNDSFDYSGTHCTHGQAGICHLPSYYISDCCEAEIER